MTHRGDAAAIARAAPQGQRLTETQQCALILAMLGLPAPEVFQHIRRSAQIGAFPTQLERAQKIGLGWAKMSAVLIQERQIHAGRGFLAKRANLRAQLLGPNQAAPRLADLSPAVVE